MDTVVLSAMGDARLSPARWAGGVLFFQCSDALQKKIRSL